MFTIACCLVAGLGLGLDLVSGWLVGSSGSMIACGARDTRIEPAQQVSVFFTELTSIRSFGQGLHTYCSV